MSNIHTILATIDETRQRSGLSKAELARRIGVKPESVRRLFSTAKPNPTSRTLDKLCAALNLELRVMPASPVEAVANPAHAHPMGQNHAPVPGHGPEPDMEFDPYHHNAAMGPTVPPGAGQGAEMPTDPNRAYASWPQHPAPARPSPHAVAAPVAPMMTPIATSVAPAQPYAPVQGYGEMPAEESAGGGGGRADNAPQTAANHHADAVHGGGHTHVWVDSSLHDPTA